MGVLCNTAVCNWSSKEVAVDLPGTPPAIAYLPGRRAGSHIVTRLEDR